MKPFISRLAGFGLISFILSAGLWPAPAAPSAPNTVLLPIVFQSLATIGGCPLFPADNIWNARVDTLPLDPDSDNYIATIGANTALHADFGSGLWEGGPIGIPFTTVPGNQPRVPITFDYADQSDPGPYPIPGRCAHRGRPAEQRRPAPADCRPRTLPAL